MIIHVTQEDICDGEKQSYLSCPIARAMKRQLGFPVGITDDTFRRSGEHISDEFPLPPEAQNFVLQFDEEKQVEPFEFEVPDETVNAMNSVKS